MTLTDFSLIRDPLPTGITLLEASAGTGKTFTITHLVIRELLADLSLEPRQVLLTTFTNAAADELADRLRLVLAQARTACADLSLTGPAADLVRGAIANGLSHVDVTHRLDLLSQQADLIRVGTMHSIANRILDEFGFETGTLAGGEPIVGDGSIVEQAVRDAWRRYVFHDALLAAALVQWPGALLADRMVVGLARRQPSPIIEPVQPSLAQARQKLLEAVDTLRDPAVFASFLSLLRSDLLNQDGIGLAADVSLAVSATHIPEHQVLSLANRCSSENIQDSIHKTFKAGKDLAKQLTNHAVCRLCSVVVHATTDVRHAWWALLAQEVPPAILESARIAGLRLSDDSLYMLDEALLNPHRGPELIRRLRQRFRLVFIDEFQDTDPIQWNIFRRIYAGSQAREAGVRLVLIGDPKQAIYGFRGGDLPTYLQAAETADHRWRLGINWRTSAPLLTAIDHLFSGERPFFDRSLSYQPAQPAPTPPAELVVPEDQGGALRWMVLAEPMSSKAKAIAELSDWTAREIARLIAVRAQLGPDLLHPGHCAVLVYNHRQARVVSQALRRYGIPCVLGDAGDLLTSETALELQRLLAAVLSPDRRTVVHTALVGRLMGYTDHLLTHLTAAHEEAISLRLDAIRRTWHYQGVASAIEEVMNESWPGGPAEPPTVHLAGEPDGERLLTDLRHAADWLSAIEHEHHMVPAGVVRYLTPVPTTGTTPDELRQRLETDARAVRIVTMHAAKGLEWPVVFCPFLWSARDLNVESPIRLRHLTGAQLVLDPSRVPQAEVLARSESLAEHIRLAYVAVTRAKVRCYVAWGAFGKNADEPQRSALGWLLGARPRDGITGWPPGTSLIDGVQQRCAVPSNEWALHPRPRPDEHGEAISTGVPIAPPTVLVPAHVHQLRPWSIGSFTRLTRHQAPHEREIPATADDHHVQSISSQPSTQQTAVAEITELPTSKLARGSGPGTAFHAVLELHDWSAPPDQAMILRTLERHGLASPTSHNDCDPLPLVTDILTNLSKLTLPGPHGFRLCDTGSSQRRMEWRFLLPVQSIHGAQLARCLAKSANPNVQAYAHEHLARLSTSQVQGYLTGSADLVVTHAGRWHIFDWKSNHLGATAADYSAANVWSAMAEDHYILQYYLYALALDRFLATRIPDYHRDACMGSAWYVFLRGVGGAPGDGIVHDQPSAEVLHELNALLRQPQFRISP